MLFWILLALAIVLLVPGIVVNHALLFIALIVLIIAFGTRRSAL